MIFMEEQPKKKKTKTIQTVGTRKKAIARATIKEGRGMVKVNSVPIEFVTPRYKNMRIREALIIAGDLANNVDIDVNVRGGGVWGQADATRTAIANALVKWTKNEKLKEMYTDYDRTLLIADARRTEPHKPSRSTAGPRRTKQQSKR
jgi:small subunit ribosomal protein S9